MPGVGCPGPSINPLMTVGKSAVRGEMLRVAILRESEDG